MINLERTAVGKAVFTVLLVFAVSSYYFPFGLSFLPGALNTKQILGVLGILVFVFNCIRDRGVYLHRYVGVSCFLACVFSVWCFFCCVYNNTEDYAYAKYFLSFFVWMGGAYGLVSLIKANHGKPVDLAMITKYLTAACVLQCVLVLMVDNIPWFQNLVDTYIEQGARPKEVKRLYGIGCSLDSGGVRFCTVLVLIAHQLATNKEVTSSRKAVYLYVGAFFIISVIGNMVARTTTVGMVLGLAYIAVTLGVAHKAVISKRQIIFWSVFLVLLAATIGVGIYYYNNDPEMKHNIRFAFEAFFNFVEKGELRTSSSDVLMERMWVWPRTEEEWVFGMGLFEWGYFYGLGMQTDIGYCRFALYCGLPGLILFALYFIYNASVVARKFKDSRLLALMLCALTFIIWIKVSTDIFQLYALLFCIIGDYELEELEAETELEE